MKIRWGVSQPQGSKFALGVIPCQFIKFSYTFQLDHLRIWWHLHQMLAKHPDETPNLGFWQRPKIFGTNRLHGKNDNGLFNNFINKIVVSKNLTNTTKTNCTDFVTFLTLVLRGYELKFWQQLSHNNQFSDLGQHSRHIYHWRICEEQLLTSSNWREFDGDCRVAAADDADNAGGEKGIIYWRQVSGLHQSLLQCHQRSHEVPLHTWKLAWLRSSRQSQPVPPELQPLLRIRWPHSPVRLTETCWW